ncbi:MULTISPECIES: HAD family hydrolase [Kaistia]|uniref:HAD family phosphatase n=1 Tax=Kaistia nematophila TaxID=2994654 RepID=A0A9X3E4A0_9HYPH|nr:HAD family phosphatase [Kaistia nematophila]MBN9025893.1 HAD family phosphatase [Hyphomicrobiales bacterium]MBN9059849.1 HAD family phosphatase [Hyphomicrobiales bacterium]MCX5570878.1 HAD family phosphatase [Kaistia nematophila]
MSEIRHIVFDIGNVLLRWDPEIPFRRLIPDDRERQRFLAEICTHDWNLEQDRGRSWADAETELIAQFPEQEARIRAWRAHWHEMVPGSLEETPGILDQLISNGHDVTALTNFAEDTFIEAQERFPYLRRFRGVTVSGRVALVKPEPEIYRLHADTFGLTPAATLFFDDNAANVEGARAAGWQAEQFIDAATMRADLARHGIELDRIAVDGVPNA